jgi:hypothetical protein
MPAYASEGPVVLVKKPGGFLLLVLGTLQAPLGLDAGLT